MRFNVKLHIQNSNRSSLEDKNAETKECFCGERIPESRKSNIRKVVCDANVIYEFGGEFYCIMHYPSSNKTKIFKEKFDDRLKTIDSFIKIEEQLSQKEDELQRKRKYFNVRERTLIAESENSDEKTRLEEEIQKIEDDITDKKNQIEELKKKIGDIKNEISFAGIWFPSEMYFLDQVYSYPVNFNYATFSKATSFVGVQFERGVDFSHVSFADVVFGKSEFKRKRRKGIFPSIDAVFSNALFFGTTRFANSKCYCLLNFSETVFEEKSLIIFEKTEIYDEILFLNSFIRGYIEFKGNIEKEPNEKKQDKDSNTKAPYFKNKSRLNLQHCKIEKDKTFSFNGINLSPGWFANTDARKFVFNNINWKNLYSKEADIEAEINSLVDIQENSRAETLAVACQQLAQNAEENNNYHDASAFRKMAFLVKEKSTKSGSPILNSLYRRISEYGESWLRVIFWWLGILIIFTVIYCFAPFKESSLEQTTKIQDSPNSENTLVIKTYDEKEKQLGFIESLKYSFGVMTFQTQENPKPKQWTEFFVWIESIIGGILIALLVLAVRRKFMK